MVTTCYDRKFSVDLSIVSLGLGASTCQYSSPARQWVYQRIGRQDYCNSRERKTSASCSEYSKPSAYY